MCLNVHCRAIFMSDLDSWDSVDVKNGLTHLDWTPDTRDTKCVLKWVLVRIAAFCCARRPQLCNSEIEYYQKVSSHAQIGPQGAEKQLRKVRVGGWVGGGGCKVQKPEQLSLHDEQSRARGGACQYAGELWSFFIMNVIIISYQIFNPPTDISYLLHAGSRCFLKEAN